MLLEGNYTKGIIVGLSSFGPYCGLQFRSVKVVLGYNAELNLFFLLSYSAVRMLLLVQSTMLVMVERSWESTRTTQLSTHMVC